jgi:hypothetical protein
MIDAQVCPMISYPWQTNALSTQHERLLELSGNFTQQISSPEMSLPPTLTYMQTDALLKSDSLSEHS